MVDSYGVSVYALWLGERGKDSLRLGVKNLMIQFGVVLFLLFGLHRGGRGVQYQYPRPEIQRLGFISHSHVPPQGGWRIWRKKLLIAHSPQD